MHPLVDLSSLLDIVFLLVMNIVVRVGVKSKFLVLCWHSTLHQKLLRGVIRYNLFLTSQETKRRNSEVLCIFIDILTALDHAIYDGSGCKGSCFFVGMKNSVCVMRSIAREPLLSTNWINWEFI